MPPICIFFLSITFLNVGIGSFLLKKAHTLGIRPGSFMVVQAFSFLVTILTALIMRGEIVQYNSDLGFGIVTGVFGIIGSLSVLISLKKGELGVNIAIVRLSFIPTVIGAFCFLGEAITARKILILFLGILSIILFLDHYQKNNPRALSSVIYAFIACLSFGVYDLFYKIASLKNLDPLAFIFIQTFTANILINIYVIFYEKYDINKTTLVIAPVCGILFAAGCIAFFKALSYSDISLISPVLQMNFILSYILGVVLLKESVTGRKIIGIACVIIAIIMLSFWKF